MMTPFAKAFRVSTKPGQSQSQFSLMLPLYAAALLGYMREDVLGLPALLDLVRNGLG